MNDLSWLSFKKQYREISLRERKMVVKALMLMLVREAAELAHSECSKAWGF